MGTELRINKFIKQFLENCTVAALNFSLKHSARTEGNAIFMILQILQDFNWLQECVEFAKKIVSFIK